MPKQRDGPAPRKTTPSQGQKGDERARLLPQPKSPRKYGRTASPSQHSRSRRRQGDPSWRGFAVRLYLKPGSDAHALYALLKLAAERFGLEVASVDEIHEADHEDH